MVKVSKQLVSRAIESRVSFGRLNQKRYITVHDTGNQAVGANASAHARLQANGNSRQASWHWQVDDREAIQSFPHEVSAFHCGDGRGNGNMHSIGVEICINSDGNYRKAVENGAKLVAKIMEQENIPLENIRQHWDWSRKNCPAQIRAGRDGINWNTFLNMVKQALNKQSTEDRKVEVVMSNDKLYRVQVGAFANKANAEKLAKELKDKGYPVYIPDSSQVTVSDNKAPAKSAPAPKPAKSIDELAQEVLAGKHGNGQARRDSLGSQFSAVQARVQEILNGRNRKSVDQIAREVIDGKWGNNPERSDRLRKAGYNPTEVQQRVNQLLR